MANGYILTKCVTHEIGEKLDVLKKSKKIKIL